MEISCGHASRMILLPHCEMLSGDSIPRSAQYSVRIPSTITPSLSESMPRTGSGSCLPVASGPAITLCFVGKWGTN